MNVMNSFSRKSWVPLALLAAALVAWGVLFAAGAYLELGADRPQHDYRKPLIVLATMGAFLAFWAVALWRRERSGTRSRERKCAKNRRSAEACEYMPEWNRTVDKRSVEAVQWALDATLMCNCDKCEKEEDLPHWSTPPWDGDSTAWATYWAPRIQAKGWSMADDGFNLLCPACRPPNNRS
jgi:hypothetical protein